MLMRNDINDQEEPLTEVGRQEMEMAAYKLPSLTSPNGPPVRLYIVAGSKHWYQAVFCLWSFAKASKRPIFPVIIDDGTMKLKQAETLQRIFPDLQIVSIGESLERLDEFLPEKHYPYLRAQQKVNPVYRKILDVHTRGTGWKLQLDADMLFFHSPKFLLDWYDNPSKALYSEDIKNAYSCSIVKLSEMIGQPVLQRVNAGIIGIRSVEIDWEMMEFWTKQLLHDGGYDHFYEQTLFALHLTGKECLVAPKKDYTVLPEYPEVYECNAVMHHYVVHSRKWYFQRNWRRFITEIISAQ